MSIDISALLAVTAIMLILLSLAWFVFNPPPVDDAFAAIWSAQRRYQRLAEEGEAQDVDYGEAESPIGTLPHQPEYLSETDERLSAWQDWANS